MNNHKDDLRRVTDLARERIQETERENHIQLMTYTIAERRILDLTDLVNQLENSFDWEYVVNILRDSSTQNYNPPLSTNSQSVPIEPLKFREVLFELFSCGGLEAVNIDLQYIFEEISGSMSFVSASSKFNELVSTHSLNQITSGTSLFFDGSKLPSEIPLAHRIRETQQQELSRAFLFKRNGQLDLSSLWTTELVRRFLAEQGTKGWLVPSDSDVLQLLPVILRRDFEAASKESEIDIAVSSFGLSIQYNDLLNAMVEHDIERLSTLGSRWGSPIISAELSRVVSDYVHSETSSTFWRIISCMNGLVRIRSDECFQSLIDLLNLKDDRIASSAIVALGNFYSQVVADVLTSLLCNSDFKEYKSPITAALSNIHCRTPRAESILLKYLRNSCSDKNAIRNILRKKKWAS